MAGLKYICVICHGITYDLIDGMCGHCAKYYNKKTGMWKI